MFLVTHNNFLLHFFMWMAAAAVFQFVLESSCDVKLLEAIDAVMSHSNQTTPRSFLTSFLMLKELNSNKARKKRMKLKRWYLFTRPLRIV